MIGRIFTNTRKHILRSGWIGIASVFVMTLAFIVASLFGGLAFVAQLHLKHFESQSNMLVFFEVDVDQDIINRLWTKWREVPGVTEIDFMSEEEAYQFYFDYTSKVSLDQHKALARYDEKKLPSSLEIKVDSLDIIDEVKGILQADVDAENEKLILVDINSPATEEDSNSQSPTEDVPRDDQTTSEGDISAVLGDSVSREEALQIQEDGSVKYKYSDDPNEPPISDPITDDENIELQKNIYSKLRIAGIGALVLLSMFIIIFIFMTVEFRLYNQKEEIGVMQLVGGSLFFIRAPYVLEGAFYGLIGVLLTTGIIGSLAALIFEFKVDPSLTNYFYENFAHLDWPQLTTGDIILWVGFFCLIGAAIGAVSSYLSIRRYIR